MKENKLIFQRDKFNSKYRVGDSVEVFKTKNNSETFIDEIKHNATILGGHTVVTWLKNNGSYNITHVKGKVK